MHVAANHEQKKKFLGRMTEEPLVAVRHFIMQYMYIPPSVVSRSQFTFKGCRPHLPCGS